MGPHLVLILLKSPLFPIEKFLTSGPQNKIPFKEALNWTLLKHALALIYTVLACFNNIKHRFVAKR